MIMIEIIEINKNIGQKMIIEEIDTGLNQDHQENINMIKIKDMEIKIRKVIQVTKINKGLEKGVNHVTVFLKEKKLKNMVKKVKSKKK